MVLMSGCGGGSSDSGSSGGSSDLGSSDSGNDYDTNPVDNILGTWNVEERVDASGCAEGIYNDSYMLTVTGQTASSLTVSANGNSFTGALNGSVLSWSGSYEEDGGTTTSSISANLSNDCNTYTGTSNWSWSDDTYSCTGTSSFTASKDSATGCVGVSDEGTTKKVSGYVLDGAINNATVCIDTNGDKQCNSNEPSSKTLSDGHYSFEYEESIDIAKFEVIADIRYESATDSDYTGGEMDYDYVLTAFNNEKEEVNLSPLSTYMNFQKKTTQKTEEEIVGDVTTLLESYEEYSYETEIELTEYVTSNYIQHEESSDEDISGLNRQLHNLNEVLARNMQQSQMQWEDAFYRDVNLVSDNWYDNSQMVIENSQYNVFEYFEEITEVVTTYSYTETFDAEMAASYFTFGRPDADDVQSVLDYMEQEENEEENSAVAGSGIIKYYTYSNPSNAIYYVYDASFLTLYYYDTNTNECTDFGTEAHLAFDGNDMVEAHANVTHASAEFVDSLPSSCGSSSSSTLSDPSISNPNVSRFPPSSGFTLPKPLPAMISSPKQQYSEPAKSDNFATAPLSTVTKSSCFNINK